MLVVAASRPLGKAWTEVYLGGATAQRPRTQKTQHTGHRERACCTTKHGHCVYSLTHSHTQRAAWNTVQQARRENVHRRAATSRKLCGCSVQSGRVLPFPFFVAPTVSLRYAVVTYLLAFPSQEGCPGLPGC